MEVLVCVDVIQQQPGAPEGFELRCNLRRQLTPHPGTKVHVERSPDHAGAETACGVDDVEKSLRLQNGTPLDQHDVQPHPQGWQTPGAGHCVACRMLAYHQASCGDDTHPVGELYRLVDLARASEIVCGDDQRFQCISSRRSRRK